jgi:acyl-CoA synthetase (AMP-forming)/AMP-acid ligase II/thioesterase domain-containing protein/acyl carrier protein/NAD(P)-dependent dehydrogenase (short-subunit alcohol dehydrogenase family)
LPIFELKLKFIFLFNEIRGKMYTYNNLQVESRRVDLQYEAFIEFVIKSIPIVQSCAVLSKNHDMEGEEFVAFIVSSAPISDEQLRSQLEARLPAHLLPKACVPLTSLPLTPEGLVDRQALDRIEAIDRSLVQEWESQILTVEGVEQVVVVETESYKHLVALHLEDIISDWQTVTSAEASLAEPLVQTQQNLSSSNINTLAISEGSALDASQVFVNTFGDILRRAADRYSDNGVVYIQEDGRSISQTYKDLKNEAERILSGLRALDLLPQDKVLFQLEKGQDFLPAFWGCVLGGFVPVPISIAPTYKDKNNTVQKLDQAWQQMNHPIVLTSQDRLTDVRSVGELFEREGFQVVAIETLRSHEPDLEWHNSQPDDLVILLLTSGSTGTPKSVMQSHRSIISQASASIEMNRFTDREISINWMPLDHVGGIVMSHLRDITLGCKQIHIPTNFILQKPLRWLDLINEHKATITWAPNFAYELINKCAPEIEKGRWNLSSLHFILNGGEAVVAKTARTFLKLLEPHGLPATSMHPAWGMSETCSGVTYSHNFSISTTKDTDQFVEVGAPVPGFSVRIVDSQHQLVPEQTIGALEVKGLSVTSGYYLNEAETKASFTKDGWFKSGDLALLKNGNLTITGRQKDVIIINGVNFYSHEIESVVQEVPLVESSFTAAFSVRTSGSNSDKLAILFHPKEIQAFKLNELINEIRELVVQKIGVNPDYLLPVQKEDIPKTAIGKIQRSQLKQRFEEGHFDSIVKQIDIVEENSNTVPPWFFNKSWHRKEIVNLMPSVKKGYALIFFDRLGLGKAISQELLKDKQKFIIIESGESFKKVSETHYISNPKNAEDYNELIQNLKLEDIAISKIFHLWTYNDLGNKNAYSSEELNLDLERGIYSLLFLIQSLDKIYSPKSSVNEIDLLVVSSHSQSVEEEDSLSPGKATILGLIKALSNELVWLNCHHIDLPSTFDLNTAQNILKESSDKSDREVCYRREQRLIPHLQKIDFAQEQKIKVPFKKGGFYLVTGGLGGVGVEVTQYLLEQYQAKILLIGRTPLPTLKDGDRGSLNSSNIGSDKYKRYLDLKTLPGEVQYQNLDIYNISYLQETVKQLETYWSSSLDGIIHLAGTYAERTVLEETKESLSAILQPKVLGTLSLHQLLQDRPNCLFVQFSSVTGFFGGSMIGAYAAANCFQECFAHFQRHTQAVQSYCFNWSSWKDTGMSQSSLAGEALLARGYQLLLVKQGINSFLAGLSTNQTALWIGLDSNNRSVRKSMQTLPYALKTLNAFLKTDNAQLPDKLSTLEVKDRYQTSSTCDFKILQEIPLTETGRVDLQALKNLRSGNTNNKVEPSSEIELKLADIWKKLLCIEQVSINDNFFAVGGSSLLGVQLLTGIEDLLGIKLAPSLLFEAPTIAKQAQFVLKNSSSPEAIVRDTQSLDNSLILLKPGSSSTPLFFAPGGGAIDVDILMYGPLFQNLSEAQSVYVLEARSFNSSGDRYSRLEDMAKDYADRIQAVQPVGPYFLGGECIGGILALEIARQLQAKGEKIALVAMLDTGVPEKNTEYIHRLRNKYKFIRGKLGHFFRRIRKTIGLYPVQSTVNTSISFSGQLSLESAQELALQGRKSHNQKELNFRRMLIFFHHIRPYEGRITLLINEARYAERYTGKAGPEWTDRRYKNDPSLGWKKIVTKGVDVQVVPGNHDTYIRDFAKNTAEILQSCLDRAKV